MPRYELYYDRKDMPRRCMAIKFANTEKEAIAQLKTVSKKNRVEFTNINVKEV